jgi:hypothetical protein
LLLWLFTWKFPFRIWCFELQIMVSKKKRVSCTGFKEIFLVSFFSTVNLWSRVQLFCGFSSNDHFAFLFISSWSWCLTVKLVLLLFLYYSSPLNKCGFCFSRFNQPQDENIRKKSVPVLKMSRLFPCYYSISNAV